MRCQVFKGKGLVIQKVSKLLGPTTCTEKTERKGGKENPDRMVNVLYNCDSLHQQYSIGGPQSRSEPRIGPIRAGPPPPTKKINTLGLVLLGSRGGSLLQCR